jgi:hypothetical protein
MVIGHYHLLGTEFMRIFPVFVLSNLEFNIIQLVFKLILLNVILKITNIIFNDLLKRTLIYIHLSMRFHYSETTTKYFSNTSFAQLMSFFIMFHFAGTVWVQFVSAIKTNCVRKKNIYMMNSLKFIVRKLLASTSIANAYPAEYDSVPFFPQ